MDRLPWELDREMHLATCGAVSVHLTPIETRLLAALLDATGRTCSRGELLD